MASLHMPAGRPAWSGSEYLNTKHPTIAALQTGFAVLGFLVFVRFTVSTGHRCFRSLRGQRPDASPTEARSQPSWSSDNSYRDEKTPFYQCRTYTMRAQVGYQGEALNAEESRPKQPVLSIHTNSESIQRHFMSRQPPAPPLTPPELSSTIFTCDDRRQNLESFMHQPNPDYMAETATADVQSTGFTSPLPRRRSYKTTLPIGIPTPQTSTAAEGDLVNAANMTFAPSSYPPTSPILPPAPPSDDIAASESDDAPSHGFDIHGEILSSLDREGAGWTRHTRVYGGGVCLACQASGARHGEGGFYGANVRPEDMRQ